MAGIPGGISLGGPTGGGGYDFGSAATSGPATSGLKLSGSTFAFGGVAAPASATGGLSTVQIAIIAAAAVLVALATK